MRFLFFHQERTRNDNIPQGLKQEMKESLAIFSGAQYVA